MANLVTWPALNEANDETVLATLTTNQPSAGTPLNLAGRIVEAFLKVAAATPDADPGVWKGSTATGEVTVTDAAAGKVSVAIPGSAVTTTKGWLRIDVVDGVLRKTGPYGPLEVTDL